MQENSIPYVMYKPDGMTAPYCLCEGENARDFYSRQLMNQQKEGTIRVSFTNSFITQKGEEYRLNFKQG